MHAWCSHASVGQRVCGDLARTKERRHLRVNHVSALLSMRSIKGQRRVAVGPHSLSTVADSPSIPDCLAAGPSVFDLPESTPPPAPSEGPGPPVQKTKTNVGYVRYVRRRRNFEAWRPENSSFLEKSPDKLLQQRPNYTTRGAPVRRPPSSPSPRLSPA